MQSPSCFHLSQGGSCSLPSCNHQRIELQVVDWSSCAGTAREESFDLSTWTPQQFDALRAFINTGAGFSNAFTEELKGIPSRPLRVFHLLHAIVGPEAIKRLYAKFTIQRYRRDLRKAGFDYPALPVPTGPRSPRVVRDLSMGPMKPRRSKQLSEVPPGGSGS